MADKKPLFPDHKRVGKKFIPPMAGVTEIHYIERILPEIAWLDYFVKHLGPRKGIETLGVFIESCFHLKESPCTNISGRLRTWSKGSTLMLSCRPPSILTSFAFWSSGNSN